ncbi:hypothetical protein KIL84_007976, partial [Mauremys mutica]
MEEGREAGMEIRQAVGRLGLVGQGDWDEEPGWGRDRTGTGWRGWGRRGSSFGGNGREILCPRERSALLSLDGSPGSPSQCLLLGKGLRVPPLLPSPHSHYFCGWLADQPAGPAGPTGSQPHCRVKLRQRGDPRPAAGGRAPLRAVAGGAGQISGPGLRPVPVSLSFPRRGLNEASSPGGCAGRLRERRGRASPWAGSCRRQCPGYVTQRNDAENPEGGTSSEKNGQENLEAAIASGKNELENPESSVVHGVNDLGYRDDCPSSGDIDPTNPEDAMCSEKNDPEKLEEPEKLETVPSSGKGPATPNSATFPVKNRLEHPETALPSKNDPGSPEGARSPEKDATAVSSERADFEDGVTPDSDVSMSESRAETPGVAMSVERCGAETAGHSASLDRSGDEAPEMSPNKVHGEICTQPSNGIPTKIIANSTPPGASNRTPASAPLIIGSSYSESSITTLPKRRSCRHARAAASSLWGVAKGFSGPWRHISLVQRSSRNCKEIWCVTQTNDAESLEGGAFSEKNEAENPEAAVTLGTNELENPGGATSLEKNDLENPENTPPHEENDLGNPDGSPSSGEIDPQNSEDATSSEKNDPEKLEEPEKPETMLSSGKGVVTPNSATTPIKDEPENPGTALPSKNDPESPGGARSSEKDAAAVSSKRADFEGSGNIPSHGEEGKTAAGKGNIEDGVIPDLDVSMPESRAESPGIASSVERNGAETPGAGASVEKSRAETPEDSVSVDRSGTEVPETSPNKVHA